MQLLSDHTPDAPARTGTSASDDHLCPHPGTRRAQVYACLWVLHSRKQNLQGVSDFVWSYETAVAISTDRVKQRICSELSLAFESCVLVSKGGDVLAAVRCSVFVACVCSLLSHFDLWCCAVPHPCETHPCLSWRAQAACNAT